MILEEADLFKEIDPGVMNEIVNICSEENYTKDTVLFRKGEEADSLYILEEGSVKLVIKDRGTITFALDQSGEVFGWSSMIESGHYTSTGVCATDSKVLKIDRDKLNRIFDRHPDVGLEVLKRLAAVISRRLTHAYQDLLSARTEENTFSYG